MYKGLEIANDLFALGAVWTLLDPGCQSNVTQCSKLQFITVGRQNVKFNKQLL